MSSATVLHVEDDPNDILLFKHACQKAGVRVNLYSVADGEEAKAYLNGEAPFSDRTAHPVPQLVLLDLKMPRVNGFELLEWLRSEAKFQRLPVIVLTSSNHDADVHRAYEAGANSYLVKPVDFNALVAMAGSVTDYWFNLNHSPAIMPTAARPALP